MNFDSLPFFQEKLFSKLLDIKTKHWVFSLASVAFGLAIMIFYFQTRPSALSYAMGEEAFSKWEHMPENEALFHSLKESLKKAPSLQEKYGAPIVQKLIDGDKIEEALFSAEKLLQGLKEEAPYHATYAMTSLLIEKKEFQMALESAVTLKEKMAKELDFQNLRKTGPLPGGAVVYAHNLLRIALLQKALQNPPGEKVAWQDFEQFLEKNEKISGLISLNFKKDDANLSTYLQARKVH